MQVHRRLGGYRPGMALLALLLGAAGCPGGGTAPPPLEDGAVELAFEPQGLRQDNTRIGPLVSRYRQPWGQFRGRITVPELGALAVDAFGVCEDHLAAW